MIVSLLEEGLANSIENHKKPSRLNKCKEKQKGAFQHLLSHWVFFVFYGHITIEKIKNTKANVSYALSCELAKGQADPSPCVLNNIVYLSNKIRNEVNIMINELIVVFILLIAGFYLTIIISNHLESKKAENLMFITFVIFSFFVLGIWIAEYFI